MMERMLICSLKLTVTKNTKRNIFQLTWFITQRGHSQPIFTFYVIGNNDINHIDYLSWGKFSSQYSGFLLRECSFQYSVFLLRGIFTFVFCEMGEIFTSVFWLFVGGNFIFVFREMGEIFTSVFRLFVEGNCIFVLRKMEGIFISILRFLVDFEST